MPRQRSATVHGTRTGYSTHGCKCDKCRTFNTQEQRKVRRLQAFGRYDKFVPAKEVRDILLILQGAGVTLGQVAIETGLTRYGLTLIAEGKTSRALRTTLEKVRDLKPEPLLYGDADTKVDCTGAVRRIQALCAIGYTLTELAAELGLDRGNLAKYTDGQHRRMGRARVLLVHDMYERLWNQPKSNKRALNWARKRGWAPPMAWDDDEIDDPSARPNWGRERSVGAQVENLTWALKTGAGWGEVLQRTGYKSPHEARRAAYLAGRPDLARSLPDSEKTSA